MHRKLDELPSEGGEIPKNRESASVSGPQSRGKQILEMKNFFYRKGKWSG